MSPQSPQPTAVIKIEDESFVREAADRIRFRLTHTVKGVIEIGRDLIAVKERLGHGKFLPWIDREFKMTDKSAERFMSVAERYGDKFDSVSNLTLTALYELAAPSTPEEVRTEVAKRVAAGESVTTAEVKELKNEIKERDDRLSKLRTQKTASDTENRVLKQGLAVRDTKLRDLTDQLDSLREELRQTQQGERANYEPMKAVLLSLWNAAPEEIKAWFRKIATKESDALDSNDVPCPAT
jgi:Protein of unknown function (DUF3102)